jgi:hypothetical protein
MTQTIELGLDTFGDVTVDHNGQLLTQAATLRHVVEEGALADQIGLDFFWPRLPASPAASTSDRQSRC